MEPLRRNLSGGVQATAADIYISYIHIYIYIYISKTYIDAEFDVESFGMVYLASRGCLNKVICEKTYLFERSVPIYGESSQPPPIHTTNIPCLTAGVKARFDHHERSRVQ